MTGQDGAAGVIADLVRTHSGAGLPVRLRLWDGSEAGPAGAPVLIARSPRALRRLLWRPGALGLARAYLSGDLDVDGDLADGLIQQMSRGGRAPGGGPFIESYIAPDMHMRPVGETVRLIENAGFEVTGVQGLREHYVRTIRAWLDNFEASLPEIAKLLTSEQIRVWRLYLAGSALAFDEGRMGVDQILAVRKPR
jgi:Mycolic acid cyclopropane synthetase